MVWLFVVVVGVRFLLPLLIPLYPLPAIVACLVVDAVDQTVFQAFGYDPPGYQGYDKAMDVYYLAIAYLSTLRNWVSPGAFQVSQFLYFYRLVGVVAFELLQSRVLLLIFPNTFEYFFIAYEAVRSRWDPVRFVRRWWIVVAGLIWVFVKLPQEYWIHVAQLDVTDTLAEYDWAWPLLIGLLTVLAAVLWFVVRPRLPEPDWPLRITPDPLPAEMDTAAERAAWRADTARVRSEVTIEKVVLVGLLSVIFAQTVPGVRASNLELLVGISVLVVLNAAVVLAAARRGRSTESLLVAFGVRIALNVGLVLVARVLLGPRDIDEGAAFFFVLLLSLLTTLHDAWQPVHAYRARHEVRTTPPRLG
ncbi:hypothetical protein [Nocardioides sp. Soil805]|uniref:hypothetical protein n=1 Tax=Nocardioides sp. Soil805 TaxID=1736416 RepID=UPI001F20FEF9|nr:hypothetical protein [Nocardioides sp. Soil805]